MFVFWGRVFWARFRVLCLEASGRERLRDVELAEAQDLPRFVVAEYASKDSSTDQKMKRCSGTP